MSRLISEYYRIRLTELGYPTENVEYRLSYSQGDGMAFYGVLDVDQMRILAQRLMPENKWLRTLIEQWDRGTIDDLYVDEVHIEIVRTNYSNHYSHARTMELENAVTIDVENGSEGGVFQAVWAANMEEAFYEFMELVEEDVKHTSYQLKREGYALREACDPYWFADLSPTANGNYLWKEWTIGNIRVRVFMREEEWLLGVDDGDEEFFMELCESLISGKQCAYIMFAEAEDLENDILLGQSTSYSVLDSLELERGRELMRTVVWEAVQEALRYYSRTETD